MQSTTFQVINENIYRAADKIENLAFYVAPVMSVPYFAVVFGGIALLKGRILSLITNGRYTTLSSEMLSSSSIQPIYMGIVKVTLIATAVLLSVLVLAAVTKCITAKLLNRNANWDNWDFLKRQFN